MILQVAKLKCLSLRRLFSKLVLPALLPGAVVLSGDLVDGKDANGRGHQQIEEWQVDHCRLMLPLEHSQANPVLDSTFTHSRFQNRGDSPHTYPGHSCALIRRSCQLRSFHDLSDSSAVQCARGSGLMSVELHMFHCASMWMGALSSGYQA